MSATEEIDTATWVAAGEGAVLDTLKTLNTSLAKQVKMLEAEVRRLRRPDTIDVLVFGNHSRLSVAMVVPHGSSDEEWTSMVDRFKKHEDSMKKKGIGFHVLENIQVGEVHASPFKN